MKKLNTLLVAAATTLLLVACKHTPTAEEARKYNDDLIGIEHPLSEKENTFIDQLSGGKTAEEIKTAYEALVKQSKEAVDAANKMEGFDNSTAYLDAAKEYFKTINSITENEYKEMAALASKTQEEITEADSKKYEELVTAVQEKSDKLLEKIQSEQKVFADKYKFEIESSEPAK